MWEPPPVETLERIEAALGYAFKDRNLLLQALVHRSHLHEFGGESSNEPLEFLGDAVLGFLVAERLVRRRPELDEGAMTRLRSALVSTTALAKSALDLGLGEALLLGRGESLSGGRRKPTLLADVFEAVVGAVYLDGGMRAARRVVWAIFGNWVDSASGVSGRSGPDSKTELQEVLQGAGSPLPRYRIAAIRGPDHAREFTVQVLVEDRLLGEGVGGSKKRAEQAAAASALEALKRTR